MFALKLCGRPIQIMKESIQPEYINCAIAVTSISEGSTKDSGKTVTKNFFFSSESRALIHEVKDSFFVRLTASAEAVRRNANSCHMPTKSTVARINRNSAMYGYPIKR